MKVVIKISLPEQKERIMYLSEEDFFVEELDKKLIINTSYEDRFSVLLSLFMMKSDWEVIDKKDYFYQIMFEDNDNVEIYNFEDVPDNFYMFMGYFAKLAGDSL